MSGQYTIYWGKVYCQSDLLGLWTWANVRPLWYWTLRRIGLFCQIVWRLPDDAPGCTRLDWRTAWAVSHIAVGLVAPIKATRFPVTMGDATDGAKETGR